jgi:multidrug efflux pump
MLIAMASVPLSLAGAFIAMWMFGFSLNTLSLIALVLAIGFVVDGDIHHAFADCRVRADASRSC